MNITSFLMSEPNLIIVNIVLTSFLCGLIWTVQIVHYPTFHYISKNNYQDFQEFHMKRISYIVIPAMTLELLFAAVLVITFFSLNYALNLLLLLTIWASTFFFSAPLHMKLESGYNFSYVKKLVSTNWPRTALWSLRLFILVYSLFVWGEGHEIF